jgi:P27 family predicted phage terminase small subunit
MGYENSGRRPQPTALKVLRGNPGKRKPNVDEPEPPKGTAVKPSGLSTGASAAWDELAPICIAMGTLTTADVRVFATMCELQSTLQQASALKDSKGCQVFTADKDSDEDGQLVLVVDASLKLERDTAVALRPFYALFGLEPVSRARIRVPKDKQPVSKWA